MINYANISFLSSLNLWFIAAGGESGVVTEIYVYWGVKLDATTDLHSQFSPAGHEKQTSRTVQLLRDSCCCFL